MGKFPLFFFDYINMLKSRYLASCSNDVVDIYAQLEHDIIIDMVKRLAKMGKVTDTSEWQAKILKEIGSLQTNISGYLSKYNSQAQKTIQQLFSDSINKAIAEDVKMFNIAQRQLSDSEKQVLQSTFSKIEDTKKINKTYARMETNHSSDKVFQKLKRLTMTVAATSENQFIQSANNAFMQVSSGAIDYDSAFKSAVQDLARKGINTVEYTDSGKRIIRTIESAVRSNIMTGINQNASEITLSNCEDLGTDLVEVSAHLGAREEHAEWQGKVYCLDGERDYLDSEGNTQHAQNFYEVCKFGEPTGICGINCRHSYYPYFEGTEKQYSDKELDEYKDNKVSFEDEEGKKHEITQYEAEQMLRGYERNIRKYKTEADAFFESGFGDSPEALKAKSKIREWQGKAKDLCNQTGIRRDYAREYIGTVSGKQPTGIKGNNQSSSSNTKTNNSVSSSSSSISGTQNKLVDEMKNLEFFKSDLSDTEKVAFENDYSKISETSKKVISKYCIDMRMKANEMKMGYYSPRDNMIHFDINEINDKSAKLGYNKNMVTFFHETGHWLDFNLFKSENKTLRDKLTDFSDLLEKDALRFVNRISRRNQSNQITTFKRNTQEEKEVFNKIAQLFYKREGYFNSISDLFDGISKHKLKDGYWHKQQGYWNRSQQVEKEAIAHFFEALASGNKKEFHIAAIFPESYKLFKDFIKGII